MLFLLLLLLGTNCQKIKVYSNLTANRIFNSQYNKYYFGINNSGLNRIPLGQKSFNHLVFVP